MRSKDFDCGHEALNRLLLRFAWPNQQANASQTYVALDAENVIGFYTLVVGEVAYDGAPARLTKGLARHPVPIMLLARMGVRVGYQGRGVGAGLIRRPRRPTSLASAPSWSTRRTTMRAASTPILASSRSPTSRSRCTA
jgi:hypothetical protein